CVDLCLEVALVDVPVPDVEDDRAQSEDDRDDQREDDDDLSALGGSRTGHGHGAVALKAVGVHSIRIVAWAPRWIVPIPKMGTSLNGVFSDTRTGSPLS